MPTKNVLKEQKLHRPDHRPDDWHLYRGKDLLVYMCEVYGRSKVAYITQYSASRISQFLIYSDLNWNKRIPLLKLQLIADYFGVRSEQLIGLLKSETPIEEVFKRMEEARTGKPQSLSSTGIPVASGESSSDLLLLSKSISEMTEMEFALLCSAIAALQTQVNDRLLHAAFAKQRCDMGKLVELIRQNLVCMKITWDEFCERFPEFKDEELKAKSSVEYLLENYRFPEDCNVGTILWMLQATLVDPRKVPGRTLRGWEYPGHDSFNCFSSVDDLCAYVGLRWQRYYDSEGNPDA